MGLNPSAWCRERLARLRSQRGGGRHAFALAICGTGVGACAGIVSISFRAAVEFFQSLVVPASGFAAVDGATRFILPVLGMALTVAVLWLVARGPVSTGVPHVLEQLGRAKGRLPLQNAVLQFVAGSLALGFGMSMGREGPAIHLGAANGSLIAEQLQVTRRAMRTLVGCGVAAAIGAAFNTPLAGVMIVIEVVLVEYSVRGFTPVLLAAITGATLGRLAYGNAPAFYVPELLCGSLRELPWFAVMGFAIGAYSALFIRISGTILRSARRLPWWGAMLAASVIVGTLGLIVPQILGVGYDVIERTLKGQYAFGTIALIAAGKLVATAVGVGARVPAGLIGPTFVMGAALGAVFGTVGTGLFPGGTSNIASYAMVGMAAMMGATLQAPLSALLAVLELTGNPHIILPGLVAIVTASVSLRHVFGCESVFVMQLRDMGYAGPSKS